MKRILSVFFLCVILFSSVSSFYAAAENERRTAYRSVDCYGKVMALTFDDGPHPEKTARILDILKKYGVKATFFVVGENAVKHPELVIRETDEGHEVGNHTFSHRYYRKKEKELFENEIGKTNKLINGLTGKKCLLFRAPGGICDGYVVAAAEKRGMKLILWNVDTRDWAGESAEAIIKNVKKNAGSGSIVLFHDHTSSKCHTEEALEILIPYFLEKGYSFLTVSELISLDNRT